jgi:hypothetical protein
MRIDPSSTRTLLAYGLFSGAVLATQPALASGVAPSDASPTQRKEAMDHFSAGKQAIEAKNWERAVAELRSSLDVIDSPNARLELSRALRDSGNLADAWAEYGRTVDSATRLAVSEERYSKTADAAKTERADIEPKLAFVTVTVAHAPPDAALKVGGRPVASAEWAGPIVVPAGTVDVVLSDAAGKELARQTVSAAEGQKSPVALDAQPPPPVEAKPEPEPPPPPVITPPPGPNLRPYAYVAGGVGVAGLAMFTILGLMDNSTYSDLKSACSGNVCPPGKQSEIDSGRTQQTLANVGLVVGALGIAGGATLFVLSLSPKPSTAPSTALVAAPGYLGLRGSL